MTGPGWLAAVLAAAMLLIAAGSVIRLAFWWLHRRAAEPAADALHVLMGVAMAGMLEPGISPFPDTVWRVVFAVAAAWFSWQAIRARMGRNRAGGWHPQAGGWHPQARRWQCAHPAPHAVECMAMIYMLVPAGSGYMRAMATPGTAGQPPANPALALLLALFMLGYIVWTADRLTSQSRARTGTAREGSASGPEPGSQEPAAATGGPAAGTALAPRADACSKIAMSLAMGYMLIMML